MDLIGQLQPKTQARFVDVYMEEELNARRQRQDAISRVRAALGIPDSPE